MSQLYALLRVRKAGWLIPKYQHAFGKHPVGVLRVGEDHLPELNRHAIVSKFMDAATGRDVDGVLPLYDARLLHWSCDVVTLTGFERVSDELGLKVLDCAQTWVLRPVEPGHE